MKRRLSHLLSLTLLALFVLSGLASAILPFLGPIQTANAAGTGTEYVIYYPNTAEFKSSFKAAYRDDKGIDHDSTINLLKQTKLIVRNGDHGLGTFIMTLDSARTKSENHPIYKIETYCTPTDHANLEKSITTPDDTRPWVRITEGAGVADRDNWGDILDDAKSDNYVGGLGDNSVGDVHFQTIVDGTGGSNGRDAKTFKVPVERSNGEGPIKTKIAVGDPVQFPQSYWAQKDSDKYTFQNATDIDGNPVGGAGGAPTIVGDTVAVLGACFPQPHGDMDSAHKVMNYWKLNASDKAIWDQAVKDAGLGDDVEGAANAADDSSDSGDAPGLDCKVTFNPLTWLVCPAVKGMVNIVGDLDNLINSLMTVGSPGDSDDPNQIFCNAASNATAKTTCKSYHTAWSSFRNISLGLIAVAGLIVVISQALGFEILDAYTIRKILPRILIASVAITLSWQLMQFFVTLTNDLGFGIRYLIYHPFTSLPDSSATLKGGGVFATSLIAGGAIAALGIFGVLSFAVTAALAVFVAFIVLIIRQMLIIILVIVAPVAIVAYVLPNTQKVYKLWWESFSKALLMFPIVAAMIAAGRVFALVSNASSDNTMGQLIGFAAYFSPYFLMPMAFRFAGGALGGIGGFINNRSKGGFDRLKQFRSGQAQQNFKKMSTGDRWQGNNPAARAFNRTTAGIGLGYKGRFGLGARGRGAADLKRRQAAKDAAQNDGALQQLGFDDNAIAVMALSGGTANGARQAARELGLTDEEAARAVGTAQAVGFNDTNATAALDLMAQNKSRALQGRLAGQAGMDLVRRSAANISNGNGQLTENMVGAFAFHSRNAGRLDLGGEAPGASAMAGWDRSSVAQHAQGFGASTGHYMQQASNIMNDVDAQGNAATYTAADKRAAAIAIAEMHAALPSATAENQTHINAALNAVGIDHNSAYSVERQLANIANGRVADDMSVSDRGFDQVDTGTVDASGRTIFQEDATTPAGPQVITVNDINGQARKYGGNIPLDQRYQQPGP